MNETYNNRIRLNEVLLNGAVSMGKGGQPHPPTPSGHFILGVGKLNVNKIA